MDESSVTEIETTDDDWRLEKEALAEIIIETKKQDHELKVNGEKKEKKEGKRRKRKKEEWNMI